MPKAFESLLLLGVVGVLGTAGAATVSLAPVADNSAQDGDINGVFDNLTIRFNLLRSGLTQAPYPGFETGDVRAGLEFNVSSIPQGSIITSATFTIHTSAAFSNLADNPGPFLGRSVAGYAGDGQVTLSDFNGLNIVSNSFTDDFDVTAFIQSLVNAGNGYAGFVVGQNTFGFGQQLYGVPYGYPGGPGPTLVIQYTVPEASSFAFISLAGATSLLRRKRSKS